MCSSIGSMTSRSTVSGDAPGYGIDTDTTGGATSGNSSVLRLKSAKMPNTTSASMVTMVMMGRRMEKSEMNTLVPCAGRRHRTHLHRRARRHALRGPNQQHVAFRHTGGDLDVLCVFISQPEGDLTFSALPPRTPSPTVVPVRC